MGKEHEQKKPEHDGEDDTAQFKRLLHGLELSTDSATGLRELGDRAGPDMKRAWDAVQRVVQDHAPDEIRENWPLERAAAAVWLQPVLYDTLTRAYRDAGAHPANPDMPEGRAEAMGQLFGAAHELLLELVLNTLDWWRTALDDTAAGDDVGRPGCRMQQAVGGVLHCALNALQPYHAREGEEEAGGRAGVRKREILRGSPYSRGEGRWASVHGTRIPAGVYSPRYRLLAGGCLPGAVGLPPAVRSKPNCRMTKPVYQTSSAPSTHSPIIAASSTASMCGIASKAACASVRKRVRRGHDSALRSSSAQSSLRRTHLGQARVWLRRKLKPPCERFNSHPRARFCSDAALRSGSGELPPASRLHCLRRLIA